MFHSVFLQIKYAIILCAICSPLNIIEIEGSTVLKHKILPLLLSEQVCIIKA